MASFNCASEGFGGSLRVLGLVGGGGGLTPDNEGLTTSRGRKWIGSKDLVRSLGLGTQIFLPKAGHEAQGVEIWYLVHLGPPHAF